ncbi:MAG TPA: glycosyltransferase family 4 protein [Planctomycetota bacterium]|nr:glycosyltransferase family 4 protein [Planctomycetota bacterium]
MRILFIHQDHCLYGASRSLLGLIAQLTLKGHSSHVLLPRDGPIRDVLERQGIPFTITPWRVWTTPDGFPRARAVLSACKTLVLNRLYVKRAMDVCREFRPDIVHTNCSRTPFGSMLARRLRVPHTWHFREFPAGPYSFGGRFSFGRLASFAWIRGTSRAVVLVSHAVRREFRRYFGALPVYVVHDGVMSLEDMKTASGIPLPAMPPFTLALVGRFDPCKQPLVALEAVRLLRDMGADLKMLVGGWGQRDDVQKVMSYIEEHGLESQVELMGFLEDVSGLFARSHAMVMPSLCDAFGRVTAEAMAYGRPVLGAAAGANPELITDGFNGYLFRAGDPVDLAEKIRLVMRDPAELRQMSRNALETASERYTDEQCADAMEAIFLSVLRDHRLGKR